jgi:hypothetical protein
MTQRARSPVLGYNHNLRHGGRVFHVQTEDSGQGYARVYTHLFFEGTILSSKKAEYDATASEDAVRGMMQQLHKTMIKELTHGGYDPHIAAFFTSRGEQATLTPPAAAPARAAAPAMVDAVVAEAQPELPAVAPLAAVAAPSIPPEITPSGLAPSEYPAAAVPAASASVAPPASVRRPAPRPKPVVVIKPSGFKRPPVVLSSSADGVVVRRNVVINVGAGAPAANGTAVPSPQPEPARVHSGARVAAREGAYGSAGASPSRVPTKQEVPPQPLAASHGLQMPWETSGGPTSAPPVVAAASPEPAPRASRQIRMPWDPPAPAGARDSFAGELVNDKSLDEVILEYLSDDTEPEER